MEFWPSAVEPAGVCLFCFLFEISFRCERELNAKPASECEDKRSVVWLWLFLDSHTKVQSCQYFQLLLRDVSEELFSFTTWNRPFPFEQKNQSNIWRPSKLGAAWSSLRAVVKYEREREGTTVLVFPSVLLLFFRCKEKISAFILAFKNGNLWIDKSFLCY